MGTTHRTSDGDLEDRLVGTYRLVSFADTADDGEVREPFGSDPQGFLFYTPQRYMSAILMRSGRPGFAAGDILGGGEAERAEAFAAFSAYAGRWRIEDGELVHDLEVTSYPNWTGTEQRRRFELDGDELRLFPPRLRMDGKMRSSRVVFRRVGP